MRLVGDPRTLRPVCLVLVHLAESYLVTHDAGSCHWSKVHRVCAQQGLRKQLLPLSRDQSLALRLFGDTPLNVLRGMGNEGVLGRLREAHGCEDLEDSGCVVLLESYT